MIIKFNFRKPVLFIMVFFLTLCFNIQRAHSWGPLTHLYIIEKVCDELEKEEHGSCPFTNLSDYERRKVMMNAMGPDVFILVDLSPKLHFYPNVNVVHSPVPWNTEYENRINFGYLYLKKAGGEGIYNSKTAKAYGWGGHISGDWIAHGQMAEIESPFKELC